MENEFDIFTKEMLMPRLTELDGMLTDAGVKHELSLADEPMPGIWVRDMEDMDVFVTFILPVGEIGQTQDFLRIGAYADDGEFIRWSVPVTGSVSIGELTALAQDFANGISRVIYPLADMAAEYTQDEDDTENMDEEAIMDSVLESYDGEEPETADFAPDGYAAMVKVQTIADMLTKEGEDHTGVITGKVPYIQVAYSDELVLTLAYEVTDEDQNRFLLHLRTDIRTEISGENVCEQFNKDASFARAYSNIPAFPVWGETDDEGDLSNITLHWAVPEGSASLSAESYAAIFRRFGREAERLIQPS